MSLNNFQVQKNQKEMYFDIWRNKETLENLKGIIHLENIPSLR